MEVLLGKSSVNGPFSIAMLNYQRVTPNPVRIDPGFMFRCNHCTDWTIFLGLKLLAVHVGHPHCHLESIRTRNFPLNFWIHWRPWTCRWSSESHGCEGPGWAALSPFVQKDYLPGNPVLPGTKKHHQASGFVWLQGIWNRPGKGNHDTMRSAQDSWMSHHDLTMTL